MSRGRLPQIAALSLMLGAAFSCRHVEARPDAQSTPQSSERGDPPVKPAPPEPAPLPTDPQALAQAVLILDGHIDLPWRLQKQLEEDGEIKEDPSGATGGNFDHPRAKAGGLDAPFMSIYIPARFEGDGAKKVADQLIDMVEGLISSAPAKFAAAPNVASVRENFARGLVSLPMGMENGSPIEGELANVAHFHARGIRYITLTHSKDNHICDSSYDQRHTHKGLSPFGREVVAEMNRVGIMVDVSHISDDSFWQVMELSTVPVIASHSSCRHFTPGFERNMSDDMIVALAKNGGVIQINFGSGFLDADVRAAGDKRRTHVKAELGRKLKKNKKLKPGTPAHAEAEAEIEAAYDAEHPRAKASVSTVADHIDHVVKLAGIEHVGLGSDFDGVGDSLPVGLEDVSKYPALFAELLKRGYTPEQIKLIAGENVLRVWSAVEAAAAG